MTRANWRSRAWSRKNAVGLPPLVVFFDGKTYWLADGNYRAGALFTLDRTEAVCDVYEGTLEDAQWYACAANATHGLRRTNKDKQRAVEMALLHPKAEGMSDNDLAAHVGVSPTTAGTVRKRLVSEGRLSKLDSRTGRDGRTIDTTNIGSKSKSKPKSKPAPPAAPPPVSDPPAEPPAEPDPEPSGFYETDDEIVFSLDRAPVEAMGREEPADPLATKPAAK